MNQTENYIVLKPIAERFSRISKTITDDEIKNLIKQELREKIKTIHFESTIEEIVGNYLEANEKEVLDLFKNELKNKFK
jgi:hypothetical protein